MYTQLQLRQIFTPNNRTSRSQCRPRSSLSIGSPSAAPRWMDRTDKRTQGTSGSVCDMYGVTTEVRTYGPASGRSARRRRQASSLTKPARGASHFHRRYQMLNYHTRTSTSTINNTVDPRASSHVRNEEARFAARRVCTRFGA